MSPADLFEQRAASAGAALRAAFLEGDLATTPTSGTPTTGVPAVEVTTTGPAVPTRGRRPGRATAAAAALATAAAVAAVFTVTGPDTDPADVLTPPAERERAVLSPPFLIASGALPDAPVHAVQDVPVPLTFEDPADLEVGREWHYRVADGVLDVGGIGSGMTVLAPTQTYDPGRPWQGQTELQPAPTDAAGWGRWLDRTGLVDVTEREQLLVGGAEAVRYSVDVGDLPVGYDQCGGGRTCVALLPMLDPQVGPGRVGTGPQIGLTDETADLTAIEVDDRVVLVLTEGERDTRDQWLPALRELVDSLRFR